MFNDFVTSLAEQYGIPAEEVSGDIEFVLGASSAGDNHLSDLKKDQVYSYFQSIYGSHAIATEDSDKDETFSRLVVRDWRQFESVDIDLGSRLTVLTGENGTGKTTLLGLLGQAFGEAMTFLGTPMRDKEGFRFRAGRRPVGDFDQIGTIGLSSGSSSKLGVREWQGMGPSFTPELAPYRTVPGLYLDAQRVIGPYQRLESIPPRFNSAQEIAQAYKQQLRSIWLPHQLVKPPSALIKEALVAAALYGEGNSMVVGDPRATEVWYGFQEVLKRLFPASLGFRGLNVDQGEVIIRTASGPFALEAASGGLSAIVTLAWQIYLHAVDSPAAFTVCFDEPENHLHPSLQRTLLPSLLEAFPRVHFVVATHSPFVVTSTREANVFALRRGSNSRVFSEQINVRGQAFTADEVLDEVLGVGVTLPLWAEDKMREILENFRTSSSADSVSELVGRLHDSGLRLTMPDVTEAVATAIEGRLGGAEK